MTTDFAVRDLRFTFALPNGEAFDGAAHDVLTISAHRAQVLVQNSVSSGILPQVCEAQIYGLTPATINRLSTVGREYGLNATTKAPFIKVEAGSLGTQSYAAVYSGPIWRSSFDGNQPEPAFTLLSNWASLLQLVAVTPTTFKGSVSAVTVLQAIAKKVPSPYGPLTIEDNGVTAVLSNPYFAGSAADQIAGVVKAAHAYQATDGVNTIAVFPKPAGTRSSGTAPTPTISAATGMIGYPQFDAQYISVRAMFDPSLVFGPGRLFKVESYLSKGIPLQAATGTWAASSVAYALSSQLVGGPWEMTIRGYPPDGVVPTPTLQGVMDRSVY